MAFRATIILIDVTLSLFITAIARIWLEESPYT